MNRIEAMQIFARVAELASFTKAADSLGLPKASTSTAVQQLEAQLGTQLLHRTTRKVQLTQDGQRFYERCKDVLADLEELNSMFQQAPQALSGCLRVDMNSGTAKYVVQRLPEFLRNHPQIQVELSCTDRRVDVVAEGFDCVVRVGTLTDSSLIVRSLGQLRVVNCASPAYLHAHGVPQTLDDLAHHQLIHYVSTLGQRSPGFEYMEGSACRYVPMQGVLTVNNIDAYENGCLAGLGIIQAPHSGMLHLIEAGRLVEVLPHYRAEPMPVSLLYAQRRNVSARVQAFMTWLTNILAPYVDRA
ncbi:LysR family transcriptional regulator [Dyella humi]|uniref:LysR family transcriptional regulator n=1 Tax=Dyella humi TaxID=1770547 RepID=A0ABW8IHX6_9GAMM